jgi:long-subunit fatty acid transport protein
VVDGRGALQVLVRAQFRLGAAYIFVKDGSINNSGNPPSIAANGLINGEYHNNVIVVSGQANYRWR